VERRRVVGTVATETDVRGLAARRVTGDRSWGAWGKVQPGETNPTGRSKHAFQHGCIGETGMDVHDGCGNENPHGVGVQLLQQVGRQYDELLNLNWDTVPVGCGA
jgi:hypothetical protein